MFECMVPRYCGVVFAVKEFRNVTNGSVEFQGHEKKVVQLASASSALFRDVRDFGTSPPKRLRVLAYPSGERFTAARRTWSNGESNSRD